MHRRHISRLCLLLCLCCPSLVWAEPATPAAAGGNYPRQYAGLEGPEPGSALEEWKARWLRPAAVTDDAPLSAQELVGGNFPIANYVDPSTATEDLDGASVAYNSSRNEYLVVWQAYLATTENNIYARRYNASGAPLSGVYAICEAQGSQVAPSVAYDAASNQYWVGWTDFRSGTLLQAYLRRLSATGTPVGSEIVASPPGLDAYATRVAAGSGRGVAVWISDPQDGNSHILTHTFDQNGNEAVVILLLSEAVGVVGEPDICYNAEDQHFMVVWPAWSNSTGWDVWGHGLTREMYAATPRFPIETATAHQLYPRVAYSIHADRYLVLWQDGRSGTSWDIYARFVARNGTTGGAAGPIWAGPFADARPSVAARGNAGDFLVAFERSITAGDRMQIYACTVSSGGSVSAPFVVRLWNNVRYAPAVASRSGSNEYLIAWTDRGALTQDDIFAQRVRHDGNLQGGVIAVALGRKGQEQPAVAFNSAAREYLVVWQDYRSGSDYVVYGRRVSSSGALLGTEMVVASAAMLHGEPVVTYNATSNQFLVVWQQVSPSSGYDIHAQRVTGSGQKTGAAILVSSGTNTTDEGQPSVAWNSYRNEYYVAWHAFTNSKWRIYGQRVSSAGQLLGTNALLSYGSEFTHAARVAYNPQQDEYLVVWQDTREENRIDVYGQRVSGVGSLIGGNLAVSTAPGSKGFCDVVYNGARNEYLVVWGDARSGGNDIYGQRLSGWGAPLGSALAVSVESVAQYAPTVVYVPASDCYLVVWRELHPATDYDLYASVVTATGAPVGRFAVATANEVQSRAEAAYNNATGQVLLVWDDFRAHNYDIYGQFWRYSAGPPPATPTPTATVPLTPVTGPYHVYLPPVLKNH